MGPAPHRAAAVRRWATGPLGAAVVALVAIAGLVLLGRAAGASFATATSNAGSALGAATLSPYVPASVGVTRVGGVCRVTWTASAAAGAPSALTYDVTDGTSTLATGVSGLSADVTTNADLTPRVFARVGGWVSATSTTSAGSCGSGNTYATQVAATPGLVGYWKLADAAGSTAAADSSGQNNPAATNTGVTFGNGSRPMPADPSTTAAYSYPSSNSGMSVGDVGGTGGLFDFSGRAGMSIAAWIRSGPPAGGNNYPDVVYKKKYVSQSQQDGWHFYVDGTVATSWSAGNLGFHRFLNGNSLGVYAPLPLSTWTHVVVTYDGTTQTMYFNGQQVASLTDTTSIVDTTQPLLLGRAWADLLAHVSIWNRGLTSAEATSLYAATGQPVAATTPQAPRNPAAGAGNGQLNVSWAAPLYDGLSAVTGYTATATPSGGGASVTCTVTGAPPATSCPVTGLTNGTTYTVTVTAANAVGTGPASTGVTATPRTAPGAPTGVSVTASTGQLGVSWTAPASNGGAAISSYTVTATPTGGGTTLTASTAGTSASFTGLVDGTTYSVTVTATNAAGTGTASSAAIGTPYPSTIMTAPVTKLWLDAQEGSTLFSDTAGTVATTAGSAVQRWKHRLGSGWDAVKPSVSGSPTLVASAVNGRPAVRFVRTTADSLAVTTAGIGAVGSADRSVFVVGSAGSSADNSTNSFQTFAAWPGAHSGVLATGYPNATLLQGAAYTSTSSMLNATTPMSASAALVGDHVASSSGGTLSASISANGKPATTVSLSGSWRTYADLLRIGASDVSPGTQYLGNLDGDIGELVVLNRAVTATERRTVAEYLSRKWGVLITPAVPTGATATAGNGQVTVSWTAPSYTGGTAITGYTVTASNGATCTTTGTSCVVSLPNGYAYTFGVTATNSVGTSATATTSAVTPTGPLTAPTGVAAARGNGQGTVSWTAVTGAGTYTVTLTGGSGGTCTATAPATSCTITGLTNGTTYSATVTMTNGQGTSAASSTATFTPAVLTTLTTLTGAAGTALVNGTLAAAQFGSLDGVAVTPSGTIYVSDSANNVIRAISGGAVTTLAGSGVAGWADGTGTAAKFDTPRGLALDSSGNLFVADSGNHRIRRVTPAGVVTTVAGNGSSGNADAPSGLNAKLNKPYGIAFSPDQSQLYIADTYSDRLRTYTFSTTAVASLTLGNGGYADGTAPFVQFNKPKGLAVDAAGNLYVADANNHRIRKMTPGGTVTTFAGSGTAGSLDGTGTAARFSSPAGLTIDGVGNLYVSEQGGHRIRRIDTAGVVTTLAGNGTAASVDGNSSVASLDDPTALVYDATQGVLWITEGAGHRVRRLA